MLCSSFFMPLVHQWPVGCRFSFIGPSGALFISLVRQVSHSNQFHWSIRCPFHAVGPSRVPYQSHWSIMCPFSFHWSNRGRFTSVVHQVSCSYLFVNFIGPLGALFMPLVRRVCPINPIGPSCTLFHFIGPICAVSPHWSIKCPIRINLLISLVHSVPSSYHWSVACVLSISLVHYLLMCLHGSVMRVL